MEGGVDNEPAQVDGSEGDTVGIVPAKPASLDLRGRQLCVFPVREIRQAAGVAELSLADNKLAAFPSSPSSFGRLVTTLQTLDLSQNRVRGLDGDCIRSLVNLRVLKLSENEIESLPGNDLGRHKCLEELYVNANCLTSVPAELARCHSLNRLEVRFNPGLLEIPLSLENAVSERKIHFYASFPDHVADGIYLGGWDASENVDALKHRGITHILSVTDLGMQPSHYPSPDFTYKFIEVADKPEADLKQHFRACLDFIDGALQGGGKILVHCAMGRSRSASVVVAHLMDTKSMKFAEALAAVEKARPCVGPNAGFLAQLEEWGSTAPMAPPAQAAQA